MEIVRIADFENSRVAEFLAAEEFLPIQQSPIWARFQKSLGVKSLRIAAFDDEKVVAFAQIFVKKLPLRATKIEIPRGPLGDPKFFTEIFAEIQKFAAEQKAIFARFDFQKSGFEAKKLKKVGEENFPLATIRINLQKPLDEILAEMKPKGRYNIRVAEKHGIAISAEKSVDEFCALLAKTTERDGFAGHPKDFYEKMLAELGENCALLVARKDSRAVAAIIVAFAGDTATYYFGASDHEFRNLMAPYLLQFSAIELAQKRGCRFYDFLGIAPENAKKHRLAGVSNFKKKFGGEVFEYPAPKISIFRPLFFALFRLAKFLRL